MQSQDLYSFIVLRDPERSQSGAPHPRIVRAWSQHQSQKDSQFRDGVIEDFKQGGISEVRQRARNLLNGLNQYLREGRLQASLSNAQIFEKLRALAMRGAETRAQGLIVEWLKGEQTLTVTDEWLVEQHSRLAAKRGDFADALLAAVITDSRTFDREDAAFNICAYEAIERMIDAMATRPPKSCAWIRPLIDGVVYFPFALTPSIDTPKRSNMELRKANSPRIDATKQSSLVVAASPQIARQYIGDLVLLKQTLRRYRLGEVAHIENVLKTELYERVYRALRRNELRTLDETDTESVTERDLQTTERDEFKRELQRSQRDEFAVSANLSATVTGKTPAYTVVVSGGASASFRRSTEQREVVAQAHAREKIERVQQRLTERVRSVREALSIKENEDTTTHGFDNKEGTDHVVGVYRWLEKELDMHLVNYGRRVFFEFVVPEPATYWRALQSRRTQVTIGLPPEKPRLPKQTGETEVELLSIADFSLQLQVAGNLTELDFPERWNDLVVLAAEWGVTLDDPPPSLQQVHFTVSVDPLTNDTSAEDLHKFGIQSQYYYESPTPRTKVGEKPLKIPDGYQTNSGEVAVKPWMTVRKRDDTFVQYESGWAILTLGGRRFGFGVGHGATTEPGMSYDDATGFVQSLDANIFADSLWLSGEILVGLTTILNGVICSIRLTCTRTQRWADLWAAKMYSRFMQAWQQRMAEHEDKASRAALDDAQRDYVRPTAVYREIERREIKRAIIDLLLLQQLDELGVGVLDSDLPPQVVLEALPTYTRIVEFLERVFDWGNLVYSFMPYFYGRKPQWENLALAASGDADFEKFLAAGAARVQLPTIPGYESAVNAFMNGLGALDPGQLIPWLATGLPIAEDLARAARDGFELSAGRMSVDASSRVASFTGTTFSDPGDLNREIRVGSSIYLVRRVITPTSVELNPVVASGLSAVEFEIGGIVIGPAIPVVLPTTLVAIDMATLSLPQFPGRYG